MTVVTRFAPSPTGYLHLGGARTALYSWLHARRHGGKFVLRIEDTDRERSDPAMADAILDSLKWLGIDWDEGPFYQSERKEVYDGYFDRLLDAELAYECYCTPEELAERREKSGDSLGFKYDGKCRDLSGDERAAKRTSGATSVLRLRMPAEPVVVPDRVRGNVEFGAEVLDDLVIRKTDGFPTFHFAVTLDDALMGINVVIRGDDHLSNTPKQIRILEALKKATGEERFGIPEYVHLALILGPDGKRYSKRHGATAVSEYRNRGFLPDALVNYLGLLGWSPGDDQEFFERDELIGRFDLDRIIKKGAIFDEQKLLWMNAQYLMKIPSSKLRADLSDPLAEFEIDVAKLQRWGIELEPEEWLKGIIELAKPRARLVPEIIDQTLFFLSEDIEIDPAASKKHFRGEQFKERIEFGLEAVETAEPWSVEGLEKAIRDGAESRGFKPPKVMHPLRVATTGRSASPGLFETIYFIGRHRAASRIRNVIAGLS